MLPAILNLIFCAVAYAILFSLISTYTIQLDWELDFKFLITVNSLLILVALLPQLDRYLWPVLISRAVLIVVMAIPYPHTMFLDAFLVTGLSISIISLLRPAYMPIVAAVYLAVYLFGKLLFSALVHGIHMQSSDIIFFIGFFSSVNLLYYYAEHSTMRLMEMNTSNIFYKETIRKLTDKSSHLLNYAAKIEEHSSTEERKRITRDLHDIIGKTFTDIIMMMEANVRNITDDPDELREIFTWVGEQSRLGLSEIRQVLYDLRSSIKEEPVALKSIIGLAESFSTIANIKVELNWTNNRSTYGQSIDTVIYRIVQEAFINALRHGDATMVRVTVREADSQLMLSIQDNGKIGVEHAVKGIGQAGMEERLRKLDGSILFKKNVEGYLVRVSIPLVPYKE
ncbi:MAG: sensor histidine kinase [Spirochaetia bacterium]|nr:sensor histidine kinase [Spirochaetia bacterium]